MAVNDVKWYGKEFMVLATKANIKAMETAGALVERETKKALSHKGSYRAYKKGNKIHFSSSPGDTPALDTGILRNSISHIVKFFGGMITGRVGPDIDVIAAKSEAGTDLDYGLYLELGTSKMAARPFLRPTLRKMRKQINDIFKRVNK